MPFLSHEQCNHKHAVGCWQDVGVCASARHPVRPWPRVDLRLGGNCHSCRCAPGFSVQAGHCAQVLDHRQSFTPQQWGLQWGGQLVTPASTRRSGLSVMAESLGAMQALSEMESHLGKKKEGKKKRKKAFSVLSFQLRGEDLTLLV